MKALFRPIVSFAIALILLFFVLWCSQARAEKLIIYNCDPEMAIGWVTWDDATKKSYTSQPVDVYGRAVIVIDPAEHKIYAITQYKWAAKALVDFKEVEVKPGVEITEIKFSCREY